MTKRRIKKIYLRGFKFFLFFCVLIAVLIAGNYLYRNRARIFSRLGGPVPTVYYSDFSTTIPTGYKIHGIDVSRYQGTINWEQVKQMESNGVKLGFAFIKATEGNTKVDHQFRRNWTETGKHEIPAGAYHFFIPGKSPQVQARNFIQTVKLRKGGLPPVLDIEKTGKVSANQLRNDVKEWLEKIESYYGVTPIIYTNISFYERYFSEGFEKYPIWIAHYLQPGKPRTNRKWTFWQHSETGRVNGINHKVDFNVFYGDSTEFRNLLVNTLP